VEKAVFLFAEQIAHAIGVFDQIVAGVSSVVICDALQSIEQAAGIDLNKSVDANIAVTCFMPSGKCQSTGRCR